MYYNMLCCLHLLAASVPLSTNDDCLPTRQRTPGTVEQAICLADGAFLGTLDWYKVEKPNLNVTRAWGRVFPSRAIWGDLPGGPIEIGQQSFAQFGSSVSSIWRQFVAVREGHQIPLILLWRGHRTDPKIVFAVGTYPATVFPSVDDLLQVRDFELEGDSPELRDELIEAVIAPERSELLWSYALRRLYQLEDDPDRRFDLVLHARIQRSAPDEKVVIGSFTGGRLRYATGLLTGKVYVSREDWSRNRSPEERRATIERLVEVFERGLSAYMAETALNRTIDQPARKTQFTDEQWGEIRARIRKAVENPDHPFHKVTAESQPRANLALERVLREPNPFAPEK